MKYLLILVIGALLMGCSADYIPPDPMVLVELERVFAADVAANGMRDGFLAHIADDGVLFVPQAVNGKEHYEAQEKRPGYLTWTPIYAEISSSGDMGWTTGPWEWREKATDSLVAASGYYNTVWKLQADSTWKFVFDMGNAHSPHRSVPAPVVTSTLDPPSHGGDLTYEQCQVELVQLERSFSSASANGDLVGAYVSRMANDIRIYRMGEYPVQGMGDVTNALSSVEGTWTWEVHHADISQSRDLAYTFGVSQLTRDTESLQFSYGRIWRRGVDGNWQLAMDIHIPLPPANSVEKGNEG